MSSKVRDYHKLAQDILETVQEENIISVARCATRLRLVLKETPKEAKEKIAAMPGVITVVENGGQFQVVIGPHVGEVYDEFIKLTNLDAVSDTEVPKGSIVNRIIATMSAVFAPFVYILAAAGILQGMLILAKLAFPAFEATGTYEVFSFISWSPFTFLPIFIGMTASKHFKANTYIAVACCAALVSPTWTEMATRIADGETISFIFMHLSKTVYTSSVLPPLFLVWLLSYFERLIEKRIPIVVRPLFLPLICLVVMVPFTIVLIGPITSMGAEGIANGYNALVKIAPPLAGAIIGGFWQVLVIFGVHWGITPVVLANFDMYGRDSFQALQTIAVIAQVGAVLGVFLKTKNKDLKGISLSAFITGLFGITEPAIYGVTLRFKKPFIFGCISGAIGAVVASFFDPYYFAYAGLPGPLTIVNGISAEFPTSFIGIVLGAIIALVGPVLLIQFFGFGETKAADTVLEKEIEGQVPPSTSKRIETKVLSPIEGDIIPLTEVPDEVFASGAMGAGIGIRPTDDKVYAPFDGVVSVMIDSKHAIGLISDAGVEVLIHVGLDTVKLKGVPFTYHVTEKQQVKQGDLLLSFDADAIQDAGYSLITPVIVTNSTDFQKIATTEQQHVSKQDLLIDLA